jgi:DNA-binding NtrC family response regulator
LAAFVPYKGGSNHRGPRAALFRVEGVPSQPGAWSKNMEKQWELLVVSAHLENRNALLRILDALPVNVFSASTVEQAHEVLATHSIRLIFSEELLPDGSYKDLLADVRSLHSHTRLILMLCTGEWKECLEGMRLGAADVIRYPLQPTDVELALIRAIRDQQVDSPHENLLKNLANPLSQTKTRGSLHAGAAKN